MSALPKTIAAACLVVAALPTPGHASTVAGAGSLCAGTITWTFTPPLSTSAGSGTVTQSWSGVCGLGVAGVSTAPPDAGEFHSLFGFEGSSTGGYSGDCGLATITVDGTAHLLVGGVVAVERTVQPLSVGIGAGVVTPDQACPISSVSGDRVVSSASVFVS